MDTTFISSPRGLSDRELIEQVRRLAGCERGATARLIGHLAELDARKLYLDEGCSSLFTYCTEVLHLSEDGAYRRIRAARAARRFPLILEMLADGSLHLTAVRLLADRFAPPHPASSGSVVVGQPGPTGAAGRANADAREGIARPATPKPRHPKVAPLAPDLYKVEFTADADTYRALCQARELLRHQIPDGNAAEVIGLALKLLVEKLAQQKLGGRKAKRRAVAASARESKSGACAAADHGAGVPARPASRHIPVGVKRQVWARDQGRCAFVGAKGRRCTERGMLEFHHVMPFAVGGPATLDNIEIRCRAHNAHEAEVRFGSRHVADRMKSGKLPAPEQLEYVMSAPPI